MSGEPQEETAARRVLLAGATGLVGARVLDRLLAEPRVARVIVVARRALDRSDPKLATVVCDFERLDEALAGVEAEVVLCCLGTTMAKAGSREAFRRVDRDYVVALARAGRAAGAARLVMVSSVGADAAARNFYLRVKGEAEAAVAALDFRALDILQPGLLLGPRAERRAGERLGARLAPLFNPLLIGGLGRYRAVPAETVARAMVALALAEGAGLTRHTNADILRRAAAP